MRVFHRSTDLKIIAVLEYHDYIFRLSIVYNICRTDETPVFYDLCNRIKKYDTRSFVKCKPQKRPFRFMDIRAVYNFSSRHTDFVGP